MTKPFVFRIILKDLLDFFIISLFVLISMAAVYLYSPEVTRIGVSIYFVEQFIEVFFINPILVIWLLALSLAITIAYFFLTLSLLGTTFGAWALDLRIVDRRTRETIGWPRALLLALGAYSGVWFLLIGPLSAWWLDPDHRGWSLRLAGAVLVKDCARSRTS